MQLRLATCFLVLLIGLTACGAQQGAPVAEQTGRRPTTTPRPTRARPTRPPATASATAAPPTATQRPLLPTAKPLANQKVLTAINATSGAERYRFGYVYSVPLQQADESGIEFSYSLTFDRDDYMYQYTWAMDDTAAGASRILAAMRVRGRYYIRGPYAAEGMDQPVWYDVGDQAPSDNLLTADMLIGSFRRANVELLRTEGIDPLAGMTCERYWGSDDFTKALIDSLMKLNSPGQRASVGAKVQARPAKNHDFLGGDTRIWVCDDGFVHKIDLSVTRGDDSATGVTYRMVFDVNDIGGDVSITPPRDAVAPGTLVLAAVVFNGGNVRAQPSVQGQVLDQVHAAEPVRLLGKSADGRWYRISNQRDVVGWVSSSLLTVEDEVARSVPVE